MRKLFLALLAIGCLNVNGACAADPTLNIYAYNIHHGAGTDGKFDLQRIAKVIAQSKPDLVALQEIDKGCRRTEDKDIAAELGKLLQMEQAFGKFMDFQGGEYGMAVLSRLPIEKVVRHPLPKGAEPRCALEVQVEVEQLGIVSFVGIHNDWTDEAIRIRQVEALLEALADRSHPTILAGDFNAERSDKSMKLLEADDWQILDKQGAKTWPAGKPQVEIDFLVIKHLPKVNVEHAVIAEKVASDHRPIHAVITVPSMVKQ